MGCGEELTLDRRAEWLYPPDIEICASVDNGLEKKIYKSIEWWEDLGYPVNSIEIIYCESHIEVGTVRIQYDEDLNDKEVDDENMLAYTVQVYHPWSCDPYGLTPVNTDLEWPEFDQMCSATIYLPRKTGAAVIKHEFGHAYGWEHTVGGWCHIMDKRANPLCLDSEGLEQ